MVKTKRKTQRRKTQKKRRQTCRAQRGGDIGGRNIPEGAVFANPINVGKGAGGVELD
jgi:hypothetical protein